MRGDRWPVSCSPFDRMRKGDVQADIAGLDFAKASVLTFIANITD